MEHPYRPTQDTPTPGVHVLAGPDRLRMAWHFVLLVGLLCIAAWALTTDLGRRMAWLVGVGVVPVGCDLVRTLHEAMLPHHVTADSRGIELAWATKAPWRPWMWRKSAAIGWDELLRVHTSTVRVNGGDTTDLHITRTLGLPVMIPHGTFSPGALAVQQLILDERDDRLEAPLREEADVAGFCSERFETPRMFRLEASPGQRAIGTLIAGLMIAGTVGPAFIIGGYAHLYMTVPGLLLGGVLLFAVWTSAVPRVIRLQAEGLAHGGSELGLTLVPWSQIRFARPTLVNGKVESVRVAVRGAPDLLLRGDYGVPLVELATLIAPSARMVQLARTPPIIEQDVAP